LPTTQPCSPLRTTTSSSRPDDPFTLISPPWSPSVPLSSPGTHLSSLLSFPPRPGLARRTAPAHANYHYPRIGSLAKPIAKNVAFDEGSATIR
jgi:hypothetical protein